MDLGGIFLKKQKAFLCPYFLSPFSILPCLFVVSPYLNRVFLFLRFCVSVQMYEMCPSAVWPCRCGREPVNETSKSFFFSTLSYRRQILWCKLYQAAITATSFV